MPAAGQRRHQVLDRADPRVGPRRAADDGAEPGVARRVEPGGDVDAEIGAAEHDAGAGRRRKQADMRPARPVCSADAGAADRRLQRPLQRRPRWTGQRRGLVGMEVKPSIRILGCRAEQRQTADATPAPWLHPMRGAPGPPSQSMFLNITCKPIDNATI